MNLLYHSQLQSEIIPLHPFCQNIPTPHQGLAYKGTIWAIATPNAEKAPPLPPPPKKNNYFTLGIKKIPPFSAFMVNKIAPFCPHNLQRENYNPRKKMSLGVGKIFIFQILLPPPPQIKKLGRPLGQLHISIVPWAGILACVPHNPYNKMQVLVKVKCDIRFTTISWSFPSLSFLSFFLFISPDNFPSHLNISLKNRTIDNFPRIVTRKK